MAIARNQVNVRFMPGTFTSKHADDSRVWNGAVDIVTDALCQLCKPGTFRLRPLRQTRWDGAPPVPFKVKSYDHGQLYLTIKPPALGNNCVYEYALSGAGDWDEHLMFQAFAKLAAEREQEIESAKLEKQAAREAPKPAPAPAAAPVRSPVLSANGNSNSLLQRITSLQEMAGRSKQREELLKQYGIQLAELKRKRDELDGQIQLLEAAEFKTLQELESDEGCRDAQAALATLEKLLL